MPARIYYAGDSTVAQNSIFSYPQTGIGQMLPLYLKQQYIVQNFAVNGRSTKSFIDEGRLAVIEQNISEGDFLFIQFGHNDEKQADPTRYSAPYSAYQDNLEAFINVARKHKAYPVLITPLYRRQFDANGVLKERSHGDYPDAMKQLGSRLNVPVIDLCELSRALFIKTGDEATKKWFMYFPAGLYPNYPEDKTDNTHLRPEGAIQFAGMIANELRKLGGVYAELLLEAAAENFAD